MILTPRRGTLVKRWSSFFIVFLIGLSLCRAQYKPAETDSLNLQDYSRTEIRQMFLDMDEETEVYQLARKSKWNNVWSITFYSVGALYTIGGLVGLSKLVNDSDQYGIGTGATVVGFGVGAVGISLGTWQSRKSKKRLQNALEIYQE